MAVLNAPEPCLGGTCYSPVACNGFGYCRDRNLLHGGIPDAATAEIWRTDAAECCQAAARGEIDDDDKSGGRGIVIAALTVVAAIVFWLVVLTVKKAMG